MTKNSLHRCGLKPLNLYAATNILLLLVIVTLAFISYLRYQNEVSDMKSSIKHRILHLFDKSSKSTDGNVIEMAGKGHEKPKATLQNITLDSVTKKLFTNVLDEPYIKRRRRHFKPSIFVDNGFRHDFILRGRHVCRKKHNPHLLIVIPSTLKDKKFRDAIRNTWMEAAETKTWPKWRVDKTVRHVFVLGRKTNTRAEKRLIKSVELESKLFGDIVLADFIDSYGNLSRKMVTALQWVRTYCPRAHYVLKCDQDTFVNVPLLLQFLSEVETKFKKRNFVIGRTHFAQPKVERKGKWATSFHDYPLRYFPLYAYGHSYIVGGGAIPALLSVANRVPVIPSEDVFVTGILPMATTGVRRLHAQCFTVCCRDIFDCEVVWNQFVSMTAVHKPRDHHRLWRSVHSGVCHPRRLFNFEVRHKKRKSPTNGKSKGSNTRVLIFKNLA